MTLAPRADRAAIYLALSAGTIAFALAFNYPLYSPTRVLWYLPLDREWVLAIKPKALGMDFMGRTLLSVLAWIVVTPVTWLIARRLRPASSRTIGLFTAWAITAILLACLHHAWSLYFRNPVPEPLPDWYEAR